MVLGGCRSFLLLVTTGWQSQMATNMDQQPELLDSSLIKMLPSPKLF